MNALSVGFPGRLKSSVTPFVYGHLQSVTVKPGDIVSRGQVIGEVGSTGETRTPTLHFEVWLNNVVRDPTKYLESETASSTQ